MTEPELRRELVLWALERNGHTAAAELWRVRELWTELHYLADGELRETHLFQGVNQGALAVAQAEEKRAELEARGWLPARAREPD